MNQDPQTDHQTMEGLHGSFDNRVAISLHLTHTLVCCLKSKSDLEIESTGTGIAHYECMVRLDVSPLYWGNSPLDQEEQSWSSIPGECSDHIPLLIWPP